VFRTASGSGQITGDTPAVWGCIVHGLAHVGVLLVKKPRARLAQVESQDGAKRGKMMPEQPVL
jgi:hypothetical protein